MAASFIFTHQKERKILDPDALVRFMLKAHVMYHSDIFPLFCVCINLFMVSSGPFGGYKGVIELPYRGCENMGEKQIHPRLWGFSEKGSCLDFICMSEKNKNAKLLGIVFLSSVINWN